MVSIELKVYALSIQWVRRLFSSSNGWISLLTFWFFDRFGVGPSVVFADPFRFCPDLLPAFYRSLLYAWRLIGGASSPSGLVIGSLTTSGPLGIDAISSKVCYNLLLSMSPCDPHCIIKFNAVYSGIDWPTTWSSLFFFPLDRVVIDVNWKIAHGVLYTADRLISFGYNIPALCFCGLAPETHEHLFFSCPLAQSGVSYIQSLLFSASPLAPPFEARHLLFGFSKDELCCIPRIFVYMLNVCKFLIWGQRNDYRLRFQPPGAPRLLAQLRSRISFFLPLFFKRFRSSRRRAFFLRQWCANGTLGSISDETLKLTL